AHILHFCRVSAMLTDPTHGQRAECASAPADCIHDSCGGSPRPRVDDVEKRGKDIFVLNAFAQNKKAHFKKKQTNTFGRAYHEAIPRPAPACGNRNGGEPIGRLTSLQLAHSQRWPGE